MKELSRERVYNGFGKIDLLKIELDNNKVISRELNVRDSGVASLLYNTVNNKYIFVKQFRIGSMCNTLEIPAGLLDVDGEGKADAIKREILEETGYVVDKCEALNIPVYYNAIGSSNETISLFYSETSTRENNGGGTENEYIEVVELTREEVLDYFNNGTFIDGKTLLSIMSKIL